MTRHEEVICDGVDKLYALSTMLVPLDGRRLIKVRMGLHVFNVLVTANSSFTEGGLIMGGETEGRTLYGLPVEIITDEQGDYVDHNSMPVFEAG